MKSLVVFDSVYGNTEKIAASIASTLKKGSEVKLAKVNEVNPLELDPLDLLVVGSPTHGGRATPDMQTFMGKVPSNALRGMRVTAFDTGISPEGRGFFMRMFLKILGYAAGRIGRTLTNKGGTLVLEPEGFIVLDREGPLMEGEEARAAEWAKSLLEAK